MSACVIAFTGIIGFVGLVVPHIVRLVLGSDNKFIIPAAMVFGAFFMLLCDSTARWIDISATIPIGVVTSLIGAPIFLYLIIRQKKGVW
jgi:iron complex transport system permease protein